MRHCYSCHATDQPLVSWGTNNDTPSEYILYCKDIHACVDRSNRAPKCRDCGTREHIIAYGAQWRCSDIIRCNSNKRLQQPAQCADCGDHRPAGDWKQDNYGRIICVNRPDCHARRGIAELRGVSTYSKDRPTNTAIPEDATDMYPPEYKGGFDAVRSARH